jgi:16S rRNA (guanine1207-N2)-methyltransferase
MDRAVETMFLALAQEGALGVQGNVLFLRARSHDGLRRFAGRLTCESMWKPHADALSAAGFESIPTLQTGTEEYDLVLLRPERQRDQTLFDLARGLRLVRPGGTLLVALPNDSGAARYERHLTELAGSVGTLSKHHCRAFWAQKTDALNSALLRQWFENGQARPLDGDPRFITAPGVFSWDEVDPGSRLLAEHLPGALAGRVADLGAGWGFLAHSILEQHPQVGALHLYDADAMALELARRNLACFQHTGRGTVAYEWHDVTQGLGFAQFDAVVMNPPFHAGHEADPRLGQKFIAAAIGALLPGGQLWLVANRFLPYERFLLDRLPNAQVVAQSGGFKILSGSRVKSGDVPAEDSALRQRRRRHRAQREPR